MTERQSRQKRKVGVESFPRSHDSNSSTHTFLFRWNKTEHRNRSRAHATSTTTLPKSTIHLSSLSQLTHNGLPFFFVPVLLPKGQHTFGSGALHPPPPITLIHFLLSLLLIDTRFLQCRSKSQELPQLKRTRHSQPIRLLSQLLPGR